jgi:hypothetical protein
MEVSLAAPLTPEGLAMSPKFLREEAARFRDLAATVDREASKQRLLSIAADYDSRARAADELTKAENRQ